MEWLMIALVLLIAFGGIAYVLPSKFQRRVGQMRLDARKQGLFTSSATIPILDAAAEDRVTSGGKVRKHERLCVVYDLGFEGSPAKPPLWQLIRYQKSQVPIPGWLLRDNQLDGAQLSDAGYWTDVAKAIADMPSGCLSIASKPNGVAWIGTESKDAVMQERFLPEVRSALDELRVLNERMSVKNSSEIDE